jgi:UDP-2-acetamido-2-deoxy-ribo-hexuluronate aminotransferase
MDKIQMVDLRGQYLRHKEEIDAAISSVLEHAGFIQGPDVKLFESNLSKYVGGSHVITCGNGTDGLQLALMSFGLRPGDEVIIPAFTYVATAEVIALLGLTAVLVDVDKRTFNIDINNVEERITSRTRAIIPVHLFGQCADMNRLMELASRRGIFLIEDSAQALGAKYTFKGCATRHAGTIGKIGVTSFFPTKSLGAYGDGGAIFTGSPELAESIRMIANHGQRAKYFHEVIGVNSRLDTLQAAILDIKLKYIDDFTNRRMRVADFYDKFLGVIDRVEIPFRDPNSTHIFHQYTIKTGERDALRSHLKARGIPSMIYYPLPLHMQKAYQSLGKGPGTFPVSEELAKTVISLPIHTEMTEDQLSYICSVVQDHYA